MSFCKLIYFPPPPSQRDWVKHQSSSTIHVFSWGLLVVLLQKPYGFFHMFRALFFQHPWNHHIFSIVFPNQTPKKKTNLPHRKKKKKKKKLSPQKKHNQKPLTHSTSTHSAWWSPWEKFKRKVSTPQRKSRSNISSEELAGPNVATWRGLTVLRLGGERRKKKGVLLGFAYKKTFKKKRLRVYNVMY